MSQVHVTSHMLIGKYPGLIPRALSDSLHGLFGLKMKDNVDAADDDAGAHE